MEKFLRKRDEPEFLTNRLSGYITPEGKIFLSDQFNLKVKRAFDLIFSSLFILFIMPWLFPIIALLIRIDSKGPIIYKQLRHGRGNKTFRCYKFRTMIKNQESDTRQASRNDARVTRIGRFLRKSSLDEIPQFFNVLMGDMSVVGPRPHAVAHNEEYRKLVTYYMLRHKVLPGITGWAQVNGWRGETDTLDKMEKRVEFDLAYIRNWTLWWDVKIVFLTLFKGFVGKNVY